LTRQTLIEGKREEDKSTYNIVRHPLDCDKYFHGEFVFYDTAGFSGDGDQKQLSCGSIRKAIKTKRSSVKKHNSSMVNCLASDDGLHLAIMVINSRSPITKPTVDNYELFAMKLTSGEVPVILVVTGCEDSVDMGQWWTDNSRDFEATYPTMKFVDVICGTARHFSEAEASKLSLERQALIRIRRKRTKSELERAISQHILVNPWKPINNRRKADSSSVAVGHSAAFMITAAGFLPIAIFGGAFCAAVGYLKKKST